jgi:pimeloyl-ACP methyl ester carboxylesterase
MRRERHTLTSGGGLGGRTAWAVGRVVHGIGDHRQVFRFLAPELVGAGFRVAAADLRGHGESSTGDWTSISRTDVAGDLVALIRHLVGGPAVIVGHSLSGGAATIAAASAPDLVSGIVEVAPFTRKVEYSVGGLLRIRRYRRGAGHYPHAQRADEVAGLVASFLRTRVLA